MNIIFFISGSVSDTYGGGQVYIQNLLQGFEEIGTVISVLSFICNDNKLKEYRYHGHSVYEIGGLEAGQRKQADELLVKLSPDLIHAHGNKMLAMELAEKHHIPCVVTAHHGGVICPAGAFLDYHDRICTKEINDKNCLRCVCRNIHGYMLWYLLLRCIPYRLRLKIADIVQKLPFILFVTPVFNSTALIASKQKMIEALKKAAIVISPCLLMQTALNNNGIKDNVLILPHGIPELSHCPMPEIRNGKVKFFFIGRICYVKGLHVMLQAFRSIDPTCYELHIIGGSANKREVSYEKALKENFLDLPVVWHGKLPHAEILSIIKDCHVMVHPTLCLEIFGLTIAESLSVGRPVLATRCGGAEMQITDGVNGWLVPPNDADAMTQKILEILQNPQRIAKYAENCRIEYFQTYVKKVLEIYMSVIAK